MTAEARVLTQIEERLGAHMAIERVLLFGSRADGTATAESDFDVLVIARSDVPFVERQSLALRAVGPRDYPLDLLVYTPAEADAESRLVGSAVYWALRQGRLASAL